MDSKEIKKRLLEDNNIERLLESLECESIKREQRGRLVTAQLPYRFNSKNRRAVQVYAQEGLSVKIRNMADFSGDIYSLVSFLEFKSDMNDLQSTFRESLLYIADLFGWNASNMRSTRTKDYVAPLKALASRSRKSNIRVPNEPISELVLNNFRTIPDYGWLKEGISLHTQEFYQIGYDYQSNRITIPIRNENGELIGVKGRLLKDEDKSDYNPKYMYLYNCNISQEWFNMYNARDSILENKRVYIFESEKSVMKMHTFGYNNAVAISSSDISEVQASMIKNLGLDIDIVLCYDKDKDVDEVKSKADMFTNRNVYGIIDVEDNLGEKDSPVDMGFDVWRYLLENHCYPITITR